MNNLTLPLRHVWALRFLVLPMAAGILAGLVYLPAAAHATSDEAFYQLSKQCHASASQYFAKLHGGQPESATDRLGQDRIRFGLRTTTTLT